MITFKTNFYIITICLILSNSIGFIFRNSGKRYFGKNEKCEKPLFLTPYIEKDKIAEAQKLSKVTYFDKTKIESYAGYLTVNKKYNSNMFFWFFKSKYNSKNAPIFLWLQGGPGTSSMYGLFNEIGPFIVINNKEIKLRNYSWLSFASIIFIDNPVGTGFSFTDDNEGLAKNQNDVKNNLYKGLIQLFRLFPEFKNNDFYLSGISYAGKYIATLANFIHTKNKKTDLKINLKGLFIGDGFVDPVNMLVYDQFLYQIGLVDQQQRDYLQRIEKKAIKQIKDEEWNNATTTLFKLSNTIVSMTKVDIYNYLSSKLTDYCNSNYETFITSNDIRCAIHVGNKTFSSCSNIVTQYLYEDISKSVKPSLEKVLENYTVVICNGQFDILVGHIMVENYIKKLDWSGAKHYYKSPRYILQTKRGNNTNTAAYANIVKNLRVILIRNAGHSTAADQPFSTFSVVHSMLVNNELKSDKYNYEWIKIK